MGLQFLRWPPTLPTLWIVEIEDTIYDWLSWIKPLADQCHTDTEMILIEGDTCPSIGRRWIIEMRPLIPIVFAILIQFRRSNNMLIGGRLRSAIQSS